MNNKLKKEFFNYFSAGGGLLRGNLLEAQWSWILEKVIKPMKSKTITDKPKKEEAYAPSLHEGASPSRAQISEIKREFRQFIKRWFLLGRESISSQAKEELDRLIDRHISQSEQRGEKREREKVKDWLFQEGYLKSKKVEMAIKPTHGTCCTCQECGRNYDDCVCESNRILEFLSQKSIKQK